MIKKVDQGRPGSVGEKVKILVETVMGTWGGEAKGEKGNEVVGGGL